MKEQGMASKQTFSDLEKTNLEVHVDMSRQRYFALEEKVETLDERMDALLVDLSDFRKEHAVNMVDLKESHADAITKLREENAMNAHSSNKLFVGAAASIIGSVLSVLVLALIAFM